MAIFKVARPCPFVPLSLSLSLPSLSVFAPHFLAFSNVAHGAVKKRKAMRAQNQLVFVVIFALSSTEENVW